MTDPPPAEATVTIASHSIELALTGKPDVKNKWGAGSIRPRFVTFTYLPEGIRAHLYGVWVREDGELTDAPCDQAYRIGDTDEWPDWMAELAREHKPAGPAPATDQAALRDRVAEALAAVLAECDAIEADYRDQHDEVAIGARAAIIRIRARVAVLEQQPAVLPTPAEDPARIDRIRPEFTEHSSVEAIDAQLRRARSQQRRWHLRAEWLISLRQRRVDQKARGEWPAAAQHPKEDA